MAAAETDPRQRERGGDRHQQAAPHGDPGHQDGVQQAAGDAVHHQRVDVVLVITSYSIHYTKLYDNLSCPREFHAFIVPEKHVITKKPVL